MMTPKKIEAALTARCNLRCVYCAHFSSASDVTHDLSTAEWLAFFEELNRCAVLRIVLSGGEVFCRSDLRELIHGIVKNRMRFSLLTNGTQIDDAIIDFIAATGRCDTVQVSVDGSRAQIHDATRGEGSFIRATEGIKTLKKYGIAVSVRVTINKYNVYDLEEITRLLLEEVGLAGCPDGLRDGAHALMNRHGLGLEVLDQAENEAKNNAEQSFLDEILGKTGPARFKIAGIDGLGLGADRVRHINNKGDKKGDFNIIGENFLKTGGGK